MSAAEQTKYTCDRCGIEVVVKRQMPNGERNGPPAEWRHIDLRGDSTTRSAGDICGVCANNYYHWWAFREEPTRD